MTEFTNICDERDALVPRVCLLSGGQLWTIAFQTAPKTHFAE